MAWPGGGSPRWVWRSPGGEAPGSSTVPAARLLTVGGLILVLAIGLFGVVMGPWLLARRVDGKPG